VCSLEEPDDRFDLARGRELPPRLSLPQDGRPPTNERAEDALGPAALDATRITTESRHLRVGTDVAHANAGAADRRMGGHRGAVKEA
jgi:hypothetical protein